MTYTRTKTQLQKRLEQIISDNIPIRNNDYDREQIAYAIIKYLRQYPISELDKQFHESYDKWEVLNQ